MTERRRIRTPRSAIRARLLIAIAAITALGPSSVLAAPDDAKADETPILNLKAYEGQVVYLDFWASWCVPCRHSFPWMNAMHKKYAEEGLVIIGVNVDRDAKAAGRFLEEMPASFTILYDPEGQLASRYELEAMPSSFLYGADGKLHESHLGFREEDTEKLEKTIQVLLQDKKENDAKKEDSKTE